MSDLFLTEGVVYPVIGIYADLGARDDQFAFEVLSGGTATFGVDYTLTIGGFVEDGRAQRGVILTILNDNLTEAPETFDFVARFVGGSSFAYHVTITGPAPPGGTMAFSPTSIEIPEGAFVPFSLTWKDFTQGTLYSISSANGTATAGQDYTAFNTTGTVIGQGYSSFTLQTIDDKTDEGDETFTLAATPGRGTGATMTVTITDNDKLRCLLDLDGDGRGSVTEISLSQAAQIQKGLTGTLKAIAIEQGLIIGQIELIKDQALNVTDERLLQAISACAGTLSGLSGNVAVQWLSAMTPYVQALTEVIISGDKLSDDTIVNGMRSLIGVAGIQLKLPTDLIAAVQALEQADDARTTGADLNQALRDLQTEMRKLQMRQDTLDQQTTDVQAQLAALNACLIKSGAVAAQDIDLSATAAALAVGSAEGPRFLSGGSSAAAAKLTLPDGMSLSAGTAASEHLSGAVGGVYMAAAGAGDDVVTVRGGAAYVDGDTGTDSLVVLDASGHAVARADILQVDLPTLTGSSVASIMLKTGGYVAGKDVEYYIFKDGYGRVANGQWQTSAFDARVTTAAANILRDASLADPMQLVDVTVAGNTSPALASYVNGLVHTAANSSSVATLSYQFFTGKIPSAGGMDYLVAPAGPNPNNLNSAYYQSFNLENRYINFAVNLGRDGDGKAAFAAAYANLSLFEATRQAYTTIFGGAPSDAKLHALLDPTLTLGGQTFTRAEYFAYYGADGPNGIGTKAAMVGFLLAEAVKADLGVYAKVNDAFLTDLADGAAFAVDIVGAYNRPEYAFHPG